MIQGSLGIIWVVDSNIFFLPYLLGEDSHFD